jgi:hypothetical protein
VLDVTDLERPKSENGLQALKRLQAMMKKIFLSVLIAIFCADTASAVDLVTLGAIAGTDNRWVLHADLDKATCIAAGEYVASKNRMLFISDGEDLEMMFSNTNWKLPLGATYEIFMRTDEHTWNILFRVETPQLMWSNTLKHEFVRDLSETTNLKMYRSDKTLIGSYSMGGSSKALTAAAKCAQRLPSVREKPNAANPFETEKDNPFKGAEKRI